MILDQWWISCLKPFPHLGFIVLSNLFWTVLPFNTMEKEDPINNLWETIDLARQICLNLQGADWTIFLLSQSRELTVDRRLVIHLQVFIQDEDSALLQDEYKARLCAENVGWVLVGESSLLKLPFPLWIKAPTEKFKQNYDISEVFTYQPLKARVSPEKVPTLPSAFESVTKKIFLAVRVIQNYTSLDPNGCLCLFKQAPLRNVGNITGVRHWRLNCEHMLKPSGEGEIKAGLCKRLKWWSLPARLLRQG